jgi:hypothetical protein
VRDRCDDARGGQAVEDELDPDRGDEEAEDLLGDQHAALIQLGSHVVRPAEDETSISSTTTRVATATKNAPTDFVSAEIVTRPTMPTGLSR